MTLGETIFKCRKKAGISQEELADMLNVTRQSISLWETDQTVPSLDNLITLSKIFKVSMDELCGTKQRSQEEPTAETRAEENSDNEQHDGKPETKKRSATQTAFIVLFALSVASVVSALLTVTIVTVCSPFAKFPMLVTEYMWICFLFVPLPLVCAVAGTVRLIKERKGKGNVIAGAIAVILLCVCGIFTPIYRGNIGYHYYYGYVNYVNETTPSALPYSENVVCSMPKTNDTNKTLARAMIKYDTKEQMNQCMENISAKLGLSNLLPKNFLDGYDKIAISKCDYFYIYNESTKEENVVTSRGGHYFFMAFNTSEKTVYIKEMFLTD